MAIQKSIADDFGTTHGTAYTAIRSVRVEYDEGTGLSVRLIVWMYKDASARSKSDAAARKAPLKIVVYDVIDADATTYFADGVLDDNAKSPLKQAYAWLKTLDDSATDNRLNVNWTTGTTDV